MTSLSRKRALQDLTLQRAKNNPSNFPSLFDLAIQTCISNLEVFGSFDGLPFHPFGQPLFEEFVKRASHWRLTTEQRQAGIILFSESYGEDFLGPEYTGIRCSLQEDIPHLGAFADCLVYLDLSGGCVAGNSPGLEDKDMAFLSGLSHLKVLNLAGLKIGDTGLSHLVRSVTFGSLGPALLEYLNLAGTDVSHRGITRLWSSQQQHQQHRQQYRRQQRQLVFRRLLGIDLTGAAVPTDVAATLFQEQDLTAEEGGWKKLDRSVELFPSRTLQEQQQAASQGNINSYFEQENRLNPMQKWVDRLNRSYKLTFGQRPDLAGEDGLGLSECLALSKLSQVHFLPLSEPLAPHQQEYIRRGEEMRRIFAEVREERSRSKKKRAKYNRDQDGDSNNNSCRSSKPSERGRPPNNGVTTSISDKDAIVGQNGLDHMFNLNMYQKVLASVRLTFGTRSRPVASNGKSSGRQEGLAFVRVRSAVKRQLAYLEQLEDVEMEEPETPSSQQQLGWSSGKGLHGAEVSTIARLKARYQRPLPSTIPDESFNRDPVSQERHIVAPIKLDVFKIEPQDHRREGYMREEFMEEEPRVEDFTQEDYKQDPGHVPRQATPFNPFAKPTTTTAVEARTSSWVFSSSVKQEPVPSQQFPGSPRPTNHFPTRRRVGQDIGNNYQYQPFIKPVAEQTSSAIYITQRSPRKESTVQQQKQGVRPEQKSLMMIKTRAEQKPVAIPRAAATTAVRTKSSVGVGANSMMQRWIKQEKQQPPSLVSEKAEQQQQSSPLPVKVNVKGDTTGLSTGIQDKKTSSLSSFSTAATTPSIIREFHFADTKQDTVNLDRWIRTCAATGAGGSGSGSGGSIAAPTGDVVKSSSPRPLKVAMAKMNKDPIKAIRFDPRDELFADKDDTETTP
ncbi:hypothetical protein BGX29_007935 [Mortierella sp. GBA35]|nr:hypothetical protein BGX29_007935 [Mortierella sp. GBA35]